MSTDLKIRAKRLGRAITEMFGHPVTSSQGLELVAKEENFPNWDAASACYRPTQPQRLLDVSAFSMIREPRPFGMFIIGRSGVGKHLQITELLLDQMKAGGPVIVVDSGRSYVKLAEAVGGRVITVQPDGQRKDKHGEAPLVVIDSEELPTGETVAALDLTRLLETERPSFVVIDETWRTSRTFRDLVPIVRGWVAEGASFCITGQSDEDVAPFLGMDAMTTTMRLSSGDPK